MIYYQDVYKLDGLIRLNWYHECKYAIIYLIEMSYKIFAFRKKHKLIKCCRMILLEEMGESHIL